MKCLQIMIFFKKKNESPKSGPKSKAQMEKNQIEYKLKNINDEI